MSEEAVPTLKLTLYGVNKDKYVDVIYVYCLRGYDLRATKSEDLSGRCEGISSGITRYTTDLDIIKKIFEAVSSYCHHPDTVKTHGVMTILVSSIINDDETDKFVQGTQRYLTSIRKEHEKFIHKYNF